MSDISSAGMAGVAPGYGTTCRQDVLRGIETIIAARTMSIRIGSGVTGMYARPLALAAMGFATLASGAPGRVIAGLGTSSPIIVEGWYGTPFVNPVGTAGEFIAVLRQALAGPAVSFAGRQLSSDGFRATMIPPSPVPVLLAAMNPAMLRLAGRAAVGVFITWTPRGEVASRLEPSRCLGRELCPVQARVHSARGEQFVVRPALGEVRPCG